MLIHSVSPPLMLSKSQYPDTSLKPFDGGYIEGFDTAQGFQVSRLHSTDPGLYLKNEYSPGGIYKI